MGIEIINELKKKKGFTSEHLSLESGVPLGTLNKILNGTTKDPKLETLKAIARVLECSLNDFDDKVEAKPSIPSEFTDAKSATEYLIKMPSMAAFGGYDIKKMNDQEIIDFANEILRQFELVSHKYKK